MTPQQRLEACLEFSRITANPKGTRRSNLFHTMGCNPSNPRDPRPATPQLEENGLVCFTALTFQRFNVAKPRQRSQISP
jgi:hypothetical protein